MPKNREWVEIPICCEKQMSVSNHIGPFVVAKCSVCGDTVYLRYGRIKKPEMIND